LNLHSFFQVAGWCRKRAVQDLAILIGSLLVFLWVAYQFALFGQWVSRDPDPVKRIDFYEAVTASALLFCGLWIFALRRANELRMEVGRRSEAEARAAEADFRAQHDPLTGLGNRAKFDRCLAALAEHQAPEGGGGALLLMDLNGFKKINDQFGHPFGDEVLRIIAQRLSSMVRGTNDQLCRLGGDEFALVMNLADSSLPDRSAVPEWIAQKIIQAIDEPVRLEGRVGRVGVAIGIVHLSPDLSAKALIAAADAALYHAKERSRAGARSYYVTSPGEIAPDREAFAERKK
jgi:diguanylate cyclase (GGDEF)-like protein